MLRQLTFRPVNEGDRHAVSDLIRRTIVPAALPGWTPAAISLLFDGSTPEAAAAAFENSVFAEVCLNEHSVIGYINCNTPRLISVVVVDPSVHRSGIGSRLLRRALEHISKVAPDASIVEVNATDFSMPFYRRHSFYPISEPFDYEGRRLVRMALWRRNPRPP